MRIFLLFVIALPACSGSVEEFAPSQITSGMRFLNESSGDDYAQVVESRAFQFPADHRSHDEYQSEWWYFTGNLETKGSRHFGFELTFFRYALTAQQSTRESEWGTTQVWMAHLAITDTEGNNFITAERFSREALGLAGNQDDPFRIWLEDWSASGEGPNILPLHLRASTDRIGLQLELQGGKPPVIHGDDGMDLKGPEYGNASHYYSLTRLETSGVLRVDGSSHEVSGTTWMDREWGTSSLSPGLEGWDWFGLQLEDGREIMYYRLRTQGGESSPYSGGSLVQSDGTRFKLSSGDVLLTPLEYWTSPETSVVYPISWQLSLPYEEMSLIIQPYLVQQELDLTVRYWEGAVRVTGTQAGENLAGSGYAELTGY